MIAPKQDELPSAPPPETPFFGCLLSVFRNLVGPGLLFVIGAAIVVNKAGLGSAWDVAFLIVLAASVAAVLLAPADSAKGPLGPGDVAPMSRSKHLALLLAAAAAVLVFAHFIAPRVF
ncbi:MAG: hypothetical protein L0170_01465 [Acidobacteria bacterium]|nr:hypothetical protein [Acidobacteriota bacterium]